MSSTVESKQIRKIPKMYTCRFTVTHSNSYYYYDNNNNNNNNNKLIIIIIIMLFGGRDVV